MNDPKFGKYGAGVQGSQHPPHGPAWKRMHRSPCFWVAAICILGAMIIYILTGNLSVWPGQGARKAVPALVP